jgi:putative Mg2+ transporter-C (MgtC) family protein
MLGGTVLHFQDILLRLGLALAVGSIIGLNRFMHHKAAGMRTHALVALGAAMATLVAVQAPGSDAQAVSRVLQGLVTGVGFIGAGVIIYDENSRVQGLTTAASIWAASILGIACGAAEFVVTAVGIVMAMAVLTFGRPIERGMARLLGRRPPPKSD